MNEMEPREEEIDSLVRTALAAPAPSLSPDFDRRIMEEVDRRSRPLDPLGRGLLTGYGLVAAATSVLVMRGQGLEWTTIAAAILVPLALAAAVPLLLKTDPQSQ